MEDWEGMTMKLVKSVSTTGVAALAVLLTPVSGALATQHIVTTALPEPSMIAFFSMGVIGLIAASRLRK